MFKSNTFIGAFIIFIFIVFFGGAFYLIWISIPYGTVEPCNELVNQCYYTYYSGKTSHTEYVSCKDTRAEYIEQVCITRAQAITLKDFYYTKNISVN